MFGDYTGAVDDNAVRAWGEELQNCKGAVLDLRAQIHERAESLSRGVEVARLSALIRRKITSLREALAALERKVPSLNMPTGEATRRTDEVMRLKREVNILEDSMRRHVSVDPKSSGPEGPMNARPHQGGFGGMAEALGATGGGRGLGGGPAGGGGAPLQGRGGQSQLETDRTADKSNSELVMLQRDMMHEQDSQLEDLSKHINSLKHISNSVSEELDLHNKMLTDLEHDMESTHAKIRKAETSMTNLDAGSSCVIC